jgi:hypothetical protein
MTIEEYLAAIREILHLRPGRIPHVWHDPDGAPHHIHDDPKYTPEERQTLFEELKRSLLIS